MLTLRFGIQSLGESIIAARVLMIQGTGSSVGKSFLVTGLCRLFAQDGYAVAPFKAQNMSLNSGVTPDGLEIGRAQVVQAEAAGVDPQVEMNPVLLKPEGERRSQLVAMGKMAGEVQAMDFLTRRKRLWGVVTDALDTLRSRFDIVVVEGAGSPAEINLRAGDIVNMAVALHADAPVLLAGDIDKGGVFASLYGTLALVGERERELIKGFIINKFRGDIELLKPGLTMFEEMTGVPVVGTLPYLTDVYVPEEDSPRMARVSEPGSGPAGGRALDVAIVAPPHLANFDEFDPLARRSGVRLRYVRRVSEFGMPDLVILPGSKTTVGDLDALQRSGIAARVTRHIADGLPTIGVCGGMQMLGKTIRDPHGVESNMPVVEGLGALDIETEMMRDKTTTRTRVRITGDSGLLAGAAGLDFTGYEIHVGVSGSGDSRGAAAVMERADGGAPIAFVDESGMVVGSYVHDMFKDEAVTSAILGNVASAVGADAGDDAGGFSQDAEYDKLAAYLRENLDIGLVYEVLGVRR